VVRILRQFRRTQFLRQPPKQRGPVPVPDGAQFIERDFACLAGRRTYKLYVPSNGADRATGLLVMLHGCTQDADDFARGTQMGAIAEKQGLVIAYPTQSRTANPSVCWNWFQTQHQRRGSGEPAIIAGLTREVMAEFGLKRAFVAGLSAGGAMAAVLAAAYPDLYEAVGIHSGLAAGSANDVVSAFAAMREGSDRIRARQGGTTHRIRTIVFHGDSDPTVHSTNADLIAEDGFCAWRAERWEKEQGRIAGGRTYSRRTVRCGGVPVIEHWMIHGGGHAWSGGSPEGSYTDATGPDASAEMARFFLAPLGESDVNSVGISEANG
jgi:poly(hydroxyalkanoate) depolymerase family esterase